MARDVDASALFRYADAYSLMPRVCLCRRLFIFAAAASAAQHIAASYCIRCFYYAVTTPYVDFSLLSRCRCQSSRCCWLHVAIRHYFDAAAFDFRAARLMLPLIAMSFDAARYARAARARRSDTRCYVEARMLRVATRARWRFDRRITMAEAPLLLICRYDYH